MAKAAGKAAMPEIIPPKDIWVGNDGAPVEIVFHGDYQSVDCSEVNDHINKLLNRYPEAIRFNFRHFPLTQVHPGAQKAAEASVGAAQHGRFLEMHNMLFKNRRQLGTISLREYAKDVGVDDKGFLNKLIDAVYGWTVRNDLLEALDAGIREIPTVFVNGVEFKGKVSYRALVEEVERQLNETDRSPDTKKKTPAGS